ncbi:MAG: AAA family ATPase, partial [Erysipelotrichaceae bacterium]|nr:AAA family ATPase [Erysipelotrichaceae bacterium]
MADELLEEISGVFAHVIYRSESYMVSRFETEEGTITVTGPSFDVEKGERYRLTGTYVDHPRYGFQFNMLTIEKELPKAKEDIISFLSSKLFKGVGTKAAQKIYDTFGDDTIDTLRQDIGLLDRVDLTVRQKQSLIEGFASLHDPENEILYYLISHGFNNLDAQKIFARFKLATIEKGEENPFSFYNEIYGMSFEKVKNYAKDIEFEDKELKFRESYLLYWLTDRFFESGDTYILHDELFERLRTKGGELFEEAFERALDNGYIIEEEDRVYLSNDYHNECFIADYLTSFPGSLCLSDEEIDEAVALEEEHSSIIYDEHQKEAIRRFFTSDISLICGGPGTGKTTIVKAMVRIFRDAFPFNNLIVLAPTGRAAKRIAEVCDVEAKTIHSLLKWDKESNTFNYGIDNPVLYDTIIIDEFSMVDNDLFASLLKAGKLFKKICIIGDDNQLPSIRPGSCLADLIASGKFPLTRLEVNFRQSEGSEIIDLANAVLKGHADLRSYTKDIVYLDPKTTRSDLVSLIREDLNEGRELEDIQVLTPMYRGNWGIDNLNVILQDAFNKRSPFKKERSFGRRIFREGDKILQLKNRPTEDVYNGDIGILEDIDMKERELMVNYQGIYIFYPFDDVTDISLAYAMSVHKSQGSEYPVVYFILSA